MFNSSPFDEILLYSKYSNHNYLIDTYYIKYKELCEWLNKNYTFCSDDFKSVSIDSNFNTKYNCSYYKILLKNPDPYIKIKYISFTSLDYNKGPKFNIQYQNEDFLNYDNIVKIFEFFTNKSLNITYEKSIFVKEDFDILINIGYYYIYSYDKWFHIGIALDFHIFEIDMGKYIEDIQWTSDNIKGKTTKNLSGVRDDFFCYN
jgi:hypothetical protein